jgi:hypothetical protein
MHEVLGGIKQRVQFNKGLDLRMIICLRPGKRILSCKKFDSFALTDVKAPDL